MKNKIITVQKGIKECLPELFKRYSKWNVACPDMKISDTGFLSMIEDLHQEYYAFLSTLTKNYSFTKSSQHIIDEYAPIFIYWHQGLDNIPLIPKLCIESIQRHAGKHKVVLLDYKQALDIVDVDNTIRKKFEEGKMPICTFSDYLRVCLLSSYKCMWIDSTMLCIKDIDNNAFNSKLFALNYHKFGRCGSDLHEYFNRFAFKRHEYVLAGSTKLFDMTKQLFEKFYAQHDYLFVYYALALFFSYLYETDKEIMEDIDSSSAGGFSEHIMRFAESKVLTHVDKVYASNNTFFKLTYKGHFNEFALTEGTVLNTILKKEKLL